MKCRKLMCMTMAAMMAAAAMTGCGATEPADDTTTLVIGGTGPLTGDHASYGTSVKNGAQIAVDEINAAGGVNGLQLQLLFKDDQMDPGMAVNEYREMLEDGMDVSLGGTTSASSIAISEESQKNGMLVLTPSASQMECTAYDNSFRVCFNDIAQGTYSAKFIQEHGLAQKVAILYESSSEYSTGIAEAFLDEAENQPFDVVQKKAFTNQDNQEFAQQLRSIKKSGAELLFMPVYAQDAALILKQAEKAKLDVVFFGVDGMDGVIEKMDKDDKDLTEGVMLLTPFAADAHTPTVDAFVAAYQEKHGVIPDQFAADAYDAVYAIKAAFEETGMASPAEEGFHAAMIAAMTKISLHGATGDMTWRVDGEPSKTAQAVVIRDGAYVTY